MDKNTLLMQCHLLPFDLVVSYTSNKEEALLPELQENGKYIESASWVCPICGASHYHLEDFDTLYPDALTGSVGHNWVCDECGYYYHEVIVQN
jgi:rubredoxin